MARLGWKKGRVCKFPWCRNKHDSHGYCKSHNSQMSRWGEVWRISKNVRVYHSQEAWDRIRKGSHLGNWKGGKTIDAEGYVRIHVYDEGDPLKGRNVYEHRYMMEKHLGRKLLRTELVHHIDGDRQNNDIVNLQLVGYKEHKRIHIHDKTINSKRRKGYIRPDIRRSRENYKRGGKDVNQPKTKKSTTKL